MNKQSTTGQCKEWGCSHRWHKNMATTSWVGRAIHSERAVLRSCSQSLRHGKFSCRRE